jgi:adenosyl cobinamide kinase/adenosyl cobinamide phosphate guanylyltransferase
MAKYKLNETAFIDNRICLAGETVEVADEVIPGPHMVPADRAARKMADSIGLVNGPLPDPIDEITSIGASPAGVKSGIAAVEDLPL